MSEMVEVVIDSMRVSLMSQQRIVILREANAERNLPIWIGVYEADAITLALREVEIARPLTWDLLKNAFDRLGVRILRVEVIDLRDETFIGNIVVETDGKILNIDSRPSDALALAVRAHVPILVKGEIMESAGITPEEDLQGQPTEHPSRSPEQKIGSDQPETEERLSIFEDFLEKLDMDNLESGEEEDDNPDEEKP
jgi:uncharacterized protein